jgi:hypothetical protein
MKMASQQTSVHVTCLLKEGKNLFGFGLKNSLQGFGWGQEVLLHLQPHQQTIYATMYV